MDVKTQREMRRSGTLVISGGTSRFTPGPLHPVDALHERIERLEAELDRERRRSERLERAVRAYRNRVEPHHTVTVFRTHLQPGDLRLGGNVPRFLRAEAEGE